MKKILIILIVQCACRIGIAQNEVCPTNEISTNPDSPSNLTAPDLKFINVFNWFAQSGGELLNVPVTDLSTYYPISSMLNPYDSDNQLCSYLANANLAELDVFPEEGWELLFINLGYYPDLTPATSENLNMPYIILYNKYRSTIRVFANAKFIEPSYTEVEVSLQFDPDEELNLSGLLRYNSGIDRTLDQTTIALGATSYAQLPSNPNEWFHVDFQVAYDPCTCLYDSRLQLVLKPIASTQIEITNSDFPEVDIDLHNNNGLDQASAIIPVAPRMITFHTMAENVEYSRVIAEKYLQRMEDEGFDASWYESLYSIHALLEVLAHAETNVIGGTEVSDAAQHAADMRVQWGLNSGVETPQIISDFVSDVEAAWGMLPAASWSYNPGTYQYTLDLAQVAWFCQQNLPAAQSFASSAITTSEDKNEFSITPSSAFGSSTIELQTAPPGNTETVNLLNPGTYPIQENDVTFPGVNGQNYPVYNEVLGLFAVLEQPKLEVYVEEVNIEGEPYPNQAQTSESCFGENGQPTSGLFTYERFTYSETHLDYKFRLSEPLQIVYNPSIPIESAEVFARMVLYLVVKRFDPEVYYGSNYVFDLEGIAYQSPQIHNAPFIGVLPMLETFQYDITLDNLAIGELSRSNIEGGIFRECISPMVPLDVFNDMVCTIDSYTAQKWYDWSLIQPCANPQSMTGCVFESHPLCQEYPHAIFDEMIDVNQETCLQTISFSPQEVGFVDLLFKIQVESEDGDLQTIFTSSRLNVGNPTSVSTNFASNFSYAQNPNPIGSYNLSSIGYFDTHNWDFSELQTFGGEYQTPPSSEPVIMPSALHSLQITGTQSKNNDVAEVVFKAQDQLVLYGDAVLPNGFTLKLEDLVEETSTPTPPVTETELAAFCDGLGGNTYSANQRSMSADAQAAKPIKAPAQLASFQAYPNPTSSALNLSLLNFSGQVQFDIYNAIGNKLQSFSKTLDGSRSMNYVACTTDDLPNGTYTIVARVADGASVTERFVVLR